MQDIQNIAAVEQTMLRRLAEAHKIWRAGRPPAPQPPKKTAATVECWNKVDETRQEFDVIRQAQEDVLGLAIGFQLNTGGWRLYTKGGVNLLASAFEDVERNHHPGFGAAVQAAWMNLGVPGDPRGVWDSDALL